MTRYIDADLFKKENERLLHCDFSYLSEATLEELIDEAPTVEAEPQWIPVSERLPKEMGLYLVTLEYKEHGKSVTTLWYHGKQIGWDFRVADVVIAWMPLPKPYEGDKE